MKNQETNNHCPFCENNQHKVTDQSAQPEDEFPFMGNFQQKVSELLVRHKSILDCITKYQESAARVNRAITKTVTWCGCINVKAERQDLPEEVSLQDFHQYVETHLEGELCKNCREVIQEEVGNHLFYLAALCNLLDVNLNETMEQELSRLNTLGRYFFS